MNKNKLFTIFVTCLFLVSFVSAQEKFDSKEFDWEKDDINKVPLNQINENIDKIIENKRIGDLNQNQLKQVSSENIGKIVSDLTPSQMSYLTSSQIQGNFNNIGTRLTELSNKELNKAVQSRFGGTATIAVIEGSSINNEGVLDNNGKKIDLKKALVKFEGIKAIKENGLYGFKFFPDKNTVKGDFDTISISEDGNILINNEHKIINLDVGKTITIEEDGTMVLPKDAEIISHNWRIVAKSDNVAVKPTLEDIIGSGQVNVVNILTGDNIFNTKGTFVWNQENIKADNAKKAVIGKTVLRGRFDAKLEEGEVAEATIFAFDGKQSSLVDKTTETKVRTIGHPLDIHFQTPTQTDILMTNNNVWIYKEGFLAKGNFDIEKDSFRANSKSKKAFVSYSKVKDAVEINAVGKIRFKKGRWIDGNYIEYEGLDDETNLFLKSIISPLTKQEEDKVTITNDNYVEGGIAKIKKGIIVNYGVYAVKGAITTNIVKESGDIIFKVDAKELAARFKDARASVVKGSTFIMTDGINEFLGINQEGTIKYEGKNPVYILSPRYVINSLGKETILIGVTDEKSFVDFMSGMYSLDWKKSLSSLKNIKSSDLGLYKSICEKQGKLCEELEKGDFKSKYFRKLGEAMEWEKKAMDHLSDKTVFKEDPKFIAIHGTGWSGAEKVKKKLLESGIKLDDEGNCVEGCDRLRKGIKSGDSVGALYDEFRRQNIIAKMFMIKAQILRDEANGKDTLLLKEAFKDLKKQHYNIWKRKESRDTAYVNTLIKEGNVELLEKVLAGKADQKYKSQAIRALAPLYEKQGNYEKALKYYKKLGDSEAIGYKIIYLNMKLGKTDTALKEINNFIQKNPKSKYAKDMEVMKIGLYLKKGDYDKAGELAAEFRRKNHNSEYDSEMLTYQAMGDINEGSGIALKRALVRLKKAVKRNPNNKQAKALLGQLESGYLGAIQNALFREKQLKQEKYEKRVANKKFYNIDPGEAVATIFGKEKYVSEVQEQVLQNLNEQQQGVMVFRALLNKGVTAGEISKMDAKQLKSLIKEKFPKIPKERRTDMFVAVKTAFQNTDVRRLTDAQFRGDFQFEKGEYIDSKYLEKTLGDKITGVINVKNIAMFLGPMATVKGVSVIGWIGKGAALLPGAEKVVNGVSIVKTSKGIKTVLEFAEKYPTARVVLEAGATYPIYKYNPDLGILADMGVGSSGLFDLGEVATKKAVKYFVKESGEEAGKLILKKELRTAAGDVIKLETKKELAEGIKTTIKNIETKQLTKESIEKATKQIRKQLTEAGISKKQIKEIIGSVDDVFKKSATKTFKDLDIKMTEEEVFQKPIKYKGKKARIVEVKC